MTTQPARPGRHPQPVRPRMVWAALLVLVGGCAAVAWGLIVVSWVWIVVGSLVVVGGMVGAWRSGLVHDVHASAPIGEELRDVVRGRNRPAPGARPAGPSESARRDAGTTSRDVAARLARTPSLPSGSGPAALLAVLVAAWLLLLQRPVLSLSAVGRATSTSESALAVVAALAALRLLNGPSRFAAAALAVGGLALMATAWLVDAGAGSTASDLTSGVLLLVAAGLGLRP